MLNRRKLLYLFGSGALLLGCSSQESPNPENIRLTDNKESFIKEIKPSDLSSDPYNIYSYHWINSPPLCKKDLEGKTVVLDFWATWCHPCIESLKELEKSWQSVNRNKTLYIGICKAKNEEIINKYLENFTRDNDITFPIVIDENGKTFKAYNIKEIPAQRLINP